MNDAEKLAERIKRQPFDAERLMSQIVLVALGNSKIRTPVKTGTLRRSETTRIEGKGLRGYLGTNVTYAPFVHNGTRFMTSRPFFAEGIADSRARIGQLLAKAGDQYLADIGDI
jgi:hypothetical protein